MNFLIQKPDWQITNLVFNSLGICFFPAQNLQTLVSGTQLIISLSCIIARKFARNYSQISKFYERPLRIDALCYICQLRLTNYNCIIVYSFSLTAIKWNLYVA